MTEKARVKAASTHFPNKEKVVVPGSEFGTENHQEGMMLRDPEDSTSGRTHSSDKPAGSAKKAPTTAARLAVTAAGLVDEEMPAKGRTHSDNASDPAAGYLEKAAGMPVIDSKPASVAADLEDGDDEEFDDGDDTTIESEFDDLGDDSGEFEAEGMDDIGIAEDHSGAEEISEAQETEAAPEAFEQEQPAEECVSLVDADDVPEDDDAELQFATIARNVHVIRSNRIIASLGLVTAKKNGIDDIYQSGQFQDVVVANIEAKGLRKGLVQSGFVLAKVKVAAKATTKMVQAKVEKQLGSKLEALAKKERSMEQCLAIAAVGINRRFFKDTNNELKAGLESELLRAGVRGGPNIVRAMFAQYGVSYAKSILTLANKISAMPDEVRNQYAEALDMTSDEDFSDEVEADLEDGDGEGDEEFEDLPTTVSAALNSSPVRRDRGVLLGGVQSSGAHAILSGNQSLV